MRKEFYLFIFAGIMVGLLIGHYATEPHDNLKNITNNHNTSNYDTNITIMDQGDGTILGMTEESYMFTGKNNLNLTENKVYKVRFTNWIVFANNTIEGDMKLL